MILRSLVKNTAFPFHLPWQTKLLLVPHSLSNHFPCGSITVQTSSSVFRGSPSLQLKKSSFWLGLDQCHFLTPSLSSPIHDLVDLVKNNVFKLFISVKLWTEARSVYISLQWVFASLKVFDVLIRWKSEEPQAMEKNPVKLHVVSYTRVNTKLINFGYVNYKKSFQDIWIWFPISPLKG